jgi:hypothetical protein
LPIGLVCVDEWLKLSILKVHVQQVPIQMILPLNALEACIII